MTKKELMIKAHKMTKEIKNEYPNVDYKFQLGLCLAYLHEVKGEVEMVELKGTEKQVAWAEDIRKNILKAIEEMREAPATRGRYIADALGEDFPKANRKDEAVKKLRKDLGNAYLDRLEEIVINEEKASKIIDMREFDINVISDLLKNNKEMGDSECS